MQCLPASCIGWALCKSALSVIAGINLCAAMVHAHAETPASFAPTETTNVSIQPLGGVDLARDFPSLTNRVLRARRITIGPGGSVAWHEHQQRPGVAYLIEGSLIEIRDDGSGVRRIERQAGDAVFESKGVLHAWENISQHPATAVVIDVMIEDTP